MPIVKLNIDFKIGQTVFLKTDTEQFERLVTGYMVEQKSITYSLACGEITTDHYSFEITSDKNIMIGLGLEK